MPWIKCIPPWYDLSIKVHHNTPCSGCEGGRTLFLTASLVGSTFPIQCFIDLSPPHRPQRLITVVGDEGDRDNSSASAFARSSAVLYGECLSAQRAPFPSVLPISSLRVLSCRHDQFQSCISMYDSASQNSVASCEVFRSCGKQQIHTSHMPVDPSCTNPVFPSTPLCVSSYSLTNLSDPPSTLIGNVIKTVFALGKALYGLGSDEEGSNSK